MKTEVTVKRVILLCSILCLVGCANMVLPWSNRIWQERTVEAATGQRSLVMHEPLNWFAVEMSDRYDVYLPKGSYRLVAEDTDFQYFEAPERFPSVVTKGSAKPSSRNLVGGIFVGKSGSKTSYPAGAYFDWEGGKKLLVMSFDFRFTSQEGKRWHFENQ